jgi:hypothetical protein
LETAGRHDTAQWATLRWIPNGETELVVSVSGRVAVTPHKCWIRLYCDTASFYQSVAILVVMPRGETVNIAALDSPCKPTLGD